MPTGKGMFGVARARMVVVGALLVAGGLPAVAGAATTNQGPAVVPSPPSGAPASSTTTVPDPNPPAPFALPSDFGYKLVEALHQNEAALTAAQRGLAGAERNLRTMQQRDVQVKRQLKQLGARERETQAQLDATRDHLRQAVAEAYIHAGSGEVMAAVTSFLNTSSAVDIGSQIHVITTYSSNERSALDDYLALKARVDEELTEISDLEDHSARNLRLAKERVTSLRTTIATSQKNITTALAGVALFHETATSALSPILGPSRLTAKQMADYIAFMHYSPNITVPIQVLAQYYLDEGTKTGVRGDVAFAQSILETGGFANPGSAPTDNNFAGIGWCDTCAHGINFPDARTGVRAQLQLLRIYVDPTFPDKTYTNPILLRGTLTLGFRGKVQTWWDLWGTWATGALYGQRVYDIYEKMVAFSAFDPATPAPTPAASPAPSTTTTTTVPHH